MSYQEGTADVFAMDLHHGNLRLHYTDANKELQTLVKESEGGRDFSGGVLAGVTIPLHI